ncbi:hypothetical protein ACLBWS_15965 [Brucellaceae bacterium D45D]
MLAANVGIGGCEPPATSSNINPLPFAPEHSFNTGARWNDEFQNGWLFNAGINYSDTLSMPIFALRKTGGARRCGAKTSVMKPISKTISAIREPIWALLRRALLRTDAGGEVVGDMTEIQLQTAVTTVPQSRGNALLLVLIGTLYFSQGLPMGLAYLESSFDQHVNQFVHAV